YLSSNSIFSGPSKDIAIIVLPAKNIVKRQLLLQKFVITNPQIAFLGKYNKWSFSIKITNLTNKTMKNLIITDYILLDEYKNLNNISLSSGNVYISYNFITWTINEL